MSLLEQLLEKKDLELYLKFRADFLNEIKQGEVLKSPSDRRELIKQRFEGRIEELTTLLEVIKAGKLKDKSKSYYHKLEKIKVNKLSSGTGNFHNISNVTIWNLGGAYISPEHPE